MYYNNATRIREPLVFFPAIEQSATILLLSEHVIHTTNHDRKPRQDKLGTYNRSISSIYSLLPPFFAPATAPSSHQGQAVGRSSSHTPLNSGSLFSRKLAIPSLLSRPLKRS